TSFFLVSALYGALLGGLIAVGFIATRRLRPANGASAPSVSGLMKQSIPYGVALGLGGLLALALEITGVIALGTSLWSPVQVAPDPTSACKLGRDSTEGSDIDAWLMAKRSAFSSSTTSPTRVRTLPN